MDAQFSQMGFGTRAVHSGNTPDPVHGGVSPAIDLSSTFAQPVPGVTSSAFDYVRCGNPTILNLNRNLAALEQGKYALSTSSGMSAVISILSILKQGDHLLVIDDVYAGTQRYLLEMFGP